RYFEQAHIKDVTAYLKLVCNPHDEMAFKRLVKLLPGIGDKAAQKLWSAFLEQWAKPKPESKTPLAGVLQGCTPSVPKKAMTGWTPYVITVSQIEVEPIRNQPSAMIRTVLEAGYEDYLQEAYTNYQSRLDDLEQLANFGVQFNSTEEFLTQLALLTSVE